MPALSRWSVLQSLPRLSIIAKFEQLFSVTTTVNADLSPKVRGRDRRDTILLSLIITIHQKWNLNGALLTRFYWMGRYLWKKTILQVYSDSKQHKALKVKTSILNCVFRSQMATSAALAVVSTSVNWEIPLTTPVTVSGIPLTLCGRFLWTPWTRAVLQEPNSV